MNFVLRTDSHKFKHWKQYPPKTTGNIVQIYVRPHSQPRNSAREMGCQSISSICMPAILVRLGLFRDC